jgi:hypothetical protein
MIRWLAPSWLAFACAGCGSNPPAAFHYSGEAHFDGRPIASGEAVFTPNIAKGNSGPSGFAIIRNGRFETRAEEGRPCAAGPATVRIHAKPRSDGSVTCEYETEVDLPTGGGELKFEIPASAGTKAFTR